MGTFATTTSINTILVRFLKGNTTSSDSFGKDLFSAHITRAEAFVKASIASKYSLPFTVIPPEITRITEDIACYYVIRSSNYQNPKEKNSYLEEFKTAFDDLKAIAEGSRKLTDTSGSEIGTRTTSMFQSNTENYTPIFGKDDPTQWQRDDDEIVDQEALRD